MQSETRPDLRIGIIGFDTSHVLAFTRLLNDPADPYHVPGAKVVAGFASASADIETSISRLEGYKEEMTRDFGIKLYSTIEEMLPEVDAVLLESNDGRRHLPEVGAVLAARKPVFIDKPLAASYADAKAIAALAQTHNCPVFSSSSLRFDAHITALREDAELGAILGCDAYTPATLEVTNPGLFWYGIHGVEILYSFMGTGCRSVSCHSSERLDHVVGIWDDGRVGTVRGAREGIHEYGATVSGANKVAHTNFSREIPIYSQLLQQIIPFFHTGVAPVPLDETLEMMAFMEAALLSERENRTVEIAEITNDTK
jgi:predicted dehydrogenase